MGANSGAGTWDHPQVFCGVCVDQSLAFYIVFCNHCLSFFPFSLGHCIVFPSLIYSI
jgi:hypothetical protein